VAFAVLPVAFAVLPVAFAVVGLAPRRLAERDVLVPELAFTGE
jgi:hypothetical protein